MIRERVESAPRMSAEEWVFYAAMLATMALANLLVFAYIAPKA